MNPPKYINWFIEESAITLEDGAPISCYRLDYKVDNNAYCDEPCIFVNIMNPMMN